ncbi:XTP/dITP diphosphatase [Methanobacterium alcaliphilum]|uniref:XTP/dITP diphosphatase n=1 Tax=Methanobacterium alcaliphilum TaxID=392018 RepID=UPI00200B6804|nr:XTP/dITP diphosphatase [Methanobacterium alcaliphilum]MCK9151137.1 XTP/dITP diphosphatase [Methanobacterium alcaliphilum]
MKVTFITGNQHKVEEAEKIFEKFSIKVQHVNLGYPELQGTLEEVAIFGAKHAAEQLGEPVIVEDAGLFIRALDWFPGPYSAYVQDTIGNSGILKLMENVKDRYAEFRSVIGYCAPNVEPEIFLGAVKGHISNKEKGNQGFAFDPLFYPKEKNKTFGELSTLEKNEFSHRSRSLEKFAVWFKSRDYNKLI